MFARRGKKERNVFKQSKVSIGALAAACLLVSSPAFTSGSAIQDAIALVRAGKGAEARAAFGGLTEAGNAEAYYHLGALYHSGIGGEQDLKRAIFWYDKASDAGVDEAKLALGSLLFKGKGVKKDLARALTLFTEAADAGLLAAQYNLGLMHAAGLAHTKEYNADEDRPRAYKWLTIVHARLDDTQERAKIEEELNFLATDMQPFEIEKGEEMAAEWLVEHGETERAQ